MDITKIISLSLFGLFTIVVVKRFNADSAFGISCLLGACITVFSLSVLFPVFEYVRQLEESMEYKGCAQILFKSAGVCLLCSCACEMCRDCGENSLGSKIELAGKCTLTAFSLPLIKAVFDYAKEFVA